MNQHCVVYIDFSRMPQNCSTYAAYIGRISDGLKRDLEGECPDMDFGKDLWDMFQTVLDKTGQNFIFVMEEWDAIFHKEFIPEKDRRKYFLWNHQVPLCSYVYYLGGKFIRAAYMF